MDFTSTEGIHLEEKTSPGEKKDKDQRETGTLPGWRKVGFWTSSSEGVRSPSRTPVISAATTRIGAPIILPRYIKTNRSILSLTSNHQGKPYADNLCFFRCLGIVLDCTCRKRCGHIRARQTRTKALCQQWISKKGLEKKTPKNFEGVAIEDLLELEKFFNVSITVLQLKQDGTGMIVWKSRLKYPKKCS